MSKSFHLEVTVKPKDLNLEDLLGVIEATPLIDDEACITMLSETRIAPRNIVHVFTALERYRAQIHLRIVANLMNAPRA